MAHYYNYIGIDSFGKHVQGHLKAPNITILHEMLKKQHVHLISAQSTPHLHVLKSILRYRGVATKSLKDWCFQLHLLLKSGIVIADAIDFIIVQKLSPSMASISKHIQIQLIQGQTLSSILKHLPYCFDNVFISLVEMGEKTGSLIQCLEHLLLYLNWQQKLKQQLSHALIYPLLLLGMTLILLSILFIILIPQMQQLLMQQQQELPLATQMLIATSDAIKNYAATILMGLGCMCFSLKILAIYCVKIKTMIARLKFSVPSIGNLLYMVEAERFTFTLKVLYKSGIGIIDCLDQAHYSVKNIWLKSKLQKVTARITQGEMLSQALIYEQIFHNYLSKFVTIGEKSGCLDDALDHANQFYVQSLQRRFDIITTLMGPTFILIIGSILIWIALAMFLPIYDHLTVIL